MVEGRAEPETDFPSEEMEVVGGLFKGFQVLIQVSDDCLSLLIEFSFKLLLNVGYSLINVILADV